jgi:signal peptidase I
MYWSKNNAPRRNDLIVFKYPADTRLDYIERCIGLPGDTVELRNGVVVINGDNEPLQFLFREHDPEEGQYVLEYEVKSEIGSPYRIRHYEDHDLKGAYESFGPIMVPKNHYFVLGDNRDNSADSRVWGFVPQENIIGKAGIIYWSWDPNVPWHRLTDKIRRSRIGNTLH